MTITLFGTCRLTNIPNHNNLNNMLNYTHSTKEVIQLIKFLKGELTISEPYNTLCFRTGIVEKKPIYYDNTYNKLFLDSDTFIIEVCSRKKYIHGGFYLHHLCVDKRFNENNQNNTQIDIFNNHTVEKQSNEEIENDILEIQKLLYPKKIIIVSHYNAKLNGEYIKDRNDLIHTLETVCKKYNITFVNPTLIMSQFKQEEVLSDDLGHYTQLGFYIFSKYMYITHS